MDDSRFLINKYYPIMKEKAKGCYTGKSQENRRPDGHRPGKFVGSIVEDICSRARLTDSKYNHEAVNPASLKDVPGYGYTFKKVPVGSMPQGTTIGQCSADFDYALVLQLPKGEYTLDDGRQILSGGPHNARITTDDAKRAIKNAVVAVSKESRHNIQESIRPTSYRNGTAVVVEIVTKDAGRFSVDLTPTIKLTDSIKTDDKIQYAYKHPVGEHTWPQRGTVLHSKLAPDLVPVAGKWGVTMAHGTAKMMQDLNQPTGKGKEYTIDKEAYRLLKGTNKIFWGKNTFNVSSFAQLTAYMKEREAHPDNADWTKEHIADRFNGMTKHLVDGFEQKNLEPYLQEATEPGKQRNLLQWQLSRSPKKIETYVNRMTSTMSNPQGELKPVMNRAGGCHSAYK